MNLDVKGRAIRILSPRGYSIPRGLEKGPRPSQPRSPDSSKIQSLRHKKLAQRTILSYLLIPSYVSGNFKIHISTDHFVVYHFALLFCLFQFFAQTISMATERIRRNILATKTCSVGSALMHQLAVMGLDQYYSHPNNCSYQNVFK